MLPASKSGSEVHVCKPQKPILLTVMNNFKTNTPNLNNTIHQRAGTLGSPTSLMIWMARTGQRARPNLTYMIASPLEKQFGSH